MQEEDHTRAEALNERDLWRRVDALVDRMTDEQIRAHGLLPLAARRRRATGRDVPVDFAHELRATRTAMMIVPALLTRIRGAVSGGLVVFKGPEVATWFPDHARSFNDLDLLVDDAERARAELLAAGFLEVPDPTGHFEDIHHLAPLVWPELPLKLEVHSTPKWPPGIPAPPLREIFDAAVPSRVAPGVEAPAPHHHALLLAGHGWGHTPLRSVRDLLDVAAVAEPGLRPQIAAAASSWGAARMWRTTERAVDWLFGDAKRPLAVPIWARHVAGLREATVLEGHVERWLSPFWLTRPWTAAGLAARQIGRDLRPDRDESWPTKARRMGRAVRHALRSKSSHGWIHEDAPPPVELPRRKRS